MISPTRDSSPGAAAPLATFFQPFYNLATDRLQGVEALARRPAADGLDSAPPSGFFDTARAAGQMQDIDLWVLDDSLARLARWREDAQWEELILTVNLSWDFFARAGAARSVTHALRRHGIPGDRLLVDIATETFRRLRAENDGALAELHRLQEHEISFCLDGFTVEDVDVLAEAVSTPVDIIKLRPSQLAERGPGPQPAADAIHDAGLPVLAAGIETAEQLQLVRDLGIEWAQGFYLGEPVDASRALEHPARLERG